MSILAVKKTGEENFNYNSRGIAFFFEVTEDPVKGHWGCWHEIRDEIEGEPAKDFYTHTKETLRKRSIFYLKSF